jgi:hypothetical protein
LVFVPCVVELYDNGKTSLRRPSTWKKPFHRASTPTSISLRHQKLQRLRQVFHIIFIPDPVCVALKLYVNSLTEFSGQPIEYEQWELAARATLVQSVYGSLLDDPPMSGDVVMEARNKELFHMLVTAFMTGSGMHLLQVNEVVDNGHMAYTSIKEWYGSAATSRSIIDHYCKKLE